MFQVRSWLRFLPDVLRKKLENRPNLQKILANTSWLYFDRMIRMGVGLLVGVWVARYLGPEQFGLLNYALAFVALFGAVASLGLNNIVVRDLVKNPEIANATLGSAFILQLFAGLLTFGLAVIAIGYVRPNDALAKLMVTILSFVMVIKSSEVVKYWFESQVSSKYTVWVENIVFLLFAGVKIFLIIDQALLIAFVWVILAEAAVVAFTLLVVYMWRVNSLLNWQVQTQRAMTLLKDSWSLILSGLAVMVYMRIDQIMLGQMLDNQAVGVYSAAVRLSEIWYFVPMAIVTSIFPALIEAKKLSEEIYYQRLQRLYDVVVLLSISVAIPMTLLSDWLILILFGSDYEGAGLILAMHIWIGLFVSLGVASGKWFLLENMSTLLFYRTIQGAVMNVALNFILIPKFGMQGCVIATLISYSFAAFWFDLFSKKTRISFYMKIKAIQLRSFYAT